jgi:hypothetical protein
VAVLRLRNSETQRHGDMDIKWKTEAQAIFLYPFTI